MQKSLSNKPLSQSYTDTQQQFKKQIISLLFPYNFKDQSLNPQKVHQNLIENYIHNQHHQYLLNYSFRNHYSQYVKVYKQFLSQKGIDIKQPQISSFYPNHYFPELRQLGQFRSKIKEYSKRYVPPLQQSTFLQLDNLFTEFGYIPNLQRYFTFFPKFLQKVRIVQKELFQKSKIDQQTTYFIGLCAAAQMGCPYMLNRMTIKYLSKGGKIQWLKDKKYTSKIGSLFNLNRKLARCIWQLNIQDIQEIVEAGFWNMNQLSLIIQIMSYIHLLCTISLGLGLIPQQNNSFVPTQKIQQILEAYRLRQVESIQKSKKQSLKEILPTLITIIQQIKNNGPISIQPKINPKKSFRKQRKNSDEEENMAIEPYMKQIGNELTEQKLVKQILHQLNYLIPQYNSIQKRRDNKQNQFTCVDFNFQFMAFPRLQSFSFVLQSTKKILALIKQSQQMGLQNFGNEIISSTKQLRKAQRYYGQNLCGFSHPQYDYKKFMTNILTMPLKFYIRLLMLSPLHLNRQVIDQINHDKGQIQLFDLGHTAILIAMAKFKLSLTLTTYYFDI